MSTKKIEIKYDTLEFIMHQIENNILELKRKNDSDDLKILMPKWIKACFRMHFQNKLGSRDFNYLYGVEIIPHYKNEIVVFNDNYSVNNVNQHLVITIESPRPFPPEFSPTKL